MTQNVTLQLSRDQVADIGLSATTLDEIHHARQLIRAWLTDHPEEPKMYDVFEQLYMMEDAARIIAAEEQAAQDRKQAA